VIIDNNGDNSVANIFAFGAFADKNSNIVYHNLTGSFPFVLLEGSVCFFVLYHYESNGIIADPIKGLDSKTLFKAYKKYSDKLTKQGFHVKLNVMDNQATKYIKQFLDENNCKLQLVKPHNHHINAAEQAIQMFKDAFIAALAMTDSNFPLQLWDKLTPLVMNTLNMMRASHVNLAISTYKALNGQYNWNQYPLALLGCKALIYEDGDTFGSWASREINGWYLGPLLDHYRCDLYCVPETRADRISESAVPSRHYVGRTGYHIYGWSAHQCRTHLGYTRRVKHQTGIFQITTLVRLQGTVHWSMYESSTTTGHSLLTHGINPTILFCSCQPSGIGDKQECQAGVNLKKILLQLTHLKLISLIFRLNHFIFNTSNLVL
jgi:hypothetical protein